MPSKPHEYVRGNPELLRRLAEEKPEFIIEDATMSASTPPVESIGAQVFIGAAKKALHDLNKDRLHNGEIGPPEDPATPQ
jgi:hypothetical protein